MGFGRIVIKDERDRAYTMPPLKRATAEIIVRQAWKLPMPHDQWDTPMCVAYAGVHYLMAGPVTNFPLNFDYLYRECQKVDQWPGEDYDGTSVRALFKVLKSLGYVTGYTWAYDVDTVAQHVLTKGPVVFGTNWYENMMETDHRGYIEPTGEDYGGHAYLCGAVDLGYKNPDGTRGRARILNSWGRWGHGGLGRAWITLKNLDQLIREGGEACAATEFALRQ